MHERRNINASSLSSQDCLLHGEERSCQSPNAQAGQFAAGLKTFPCPDYLDAKSRLIEAWL